MKTAYFDCFSGISGDMTLGAMVDLGVPFEELKAFLQTLPIEGYTIESKHVSRCGIGGTRVVVTLTDHEHHDHPDHGHGHSHNHEHHHDHDHEHEHDHHHEHEHLHDDHHGHERDPVHSHDHGHPHEHSHHEEPSHSHGHEHGHHHAPHRGFTEIREIIEKSDVSDWVKQHAIGAFHRIAVEEAAVHESTIEAVHFHEIGAVDAIVDIVGSFWCLEKLGVRRVVSSPVAVGSGTIRVAHGEMPVPAPATARLLRGVPICSGSVGGELTTPTGAAILTELADSFGPIRDFAIEKIGYGAGMREYPDHTNYLRVLLGETRTAGVEGLPVIRETLCVLTAEIDDMSGEVYGHLLEQLLRAGALDCHFIPAQMKKNRPATSLHVLCRSDLESALLEIIFRETTTFGVRSTPCTRYRMNRKWETVSTPWGDVRVKIGLWGENEWKRSPEFEDCRAMAEKAGVPIREVFLAALLARKAN